MPRRSSERAKPVRRSAARVRTSGSAGCTSDARTSSSTADIRNAASISASSCSRSVDSMLARSSVDRVELARGACELVVELGQHLLLHLAHGDLDRRARAVRERERDLLRLAGRRADQRGLDLGSEPSSAELDDGVRLRLAVRVHEVDEERVAGLGGAVAGRRELGDGFAQRLDLGVDGLLRNLDLGARDLERSSSRRARAAPAPRRSRRSSRPRRRCREARTRTAGRRRAARGCATRHSRTTRRCGCRRPRRRCAPSRAARREPASGSSPCGSRGS